MDSSTTEEPTVNTIINHPAVALPYAKMVAAEYAREAEALRRIKAAREAQFEAQPHPTPRRRIHWPWPRVPANPVTT